MSEATERLTDFNSIVKEIRSDYERQIQTLKDQMFAATIELEMVKQARDAALEAEKSATRIAVQLITEFSSCEAAFSRAKRLALQIDAHMPDEAQAARDRRAADDNARNYAPSVIKSGTGTLVEVVVPGLTDKPAFVKGIDPPHSGKPGPMDHVQMIGRAPREINAGPRVDDYTGMTATERLRASAGT